MKRIFLGFCVAGLLSLVAITTNAQYKQGDNLLNLGIGLNSYYNGGTPVSGIFEAGVSKVISFGGGIDYLSYHYGFVGYNYSYSALYIGARGSYHFNELLNLNSKKVDIYGGLSLGYRSFSWSDNNVNSNGLNGNYASGIYLALHVGGRYYFSDRVAGFLELGALGSSNARIGVTFKF